MGILVRGRLTGRVRCRGLSAEIEGQMSSAGDKVAAVAEVGLWVLAGLSLLFFVFYPYK